MLQFHEYLVNYRLTPRSRILRKHMPKMETVVEQESAFESSSILMSQGHTVAHSNYSKNTKFRYLPKDPNDLERAIESESSEEEIDEIMEKDIIDQINRQFLAKS